MCTHAAARSGLPADQHAVFPLQQTLHMFHNPLLIICLLQMHV